MNKTTLPTAAEIALALAADESPPSKHPITAKVAAGENPDEAFNPGKRLSRSDIKNCRAIIGSRAPQLTDAMRTFQAEHESDLKNCEPVSTTAANAAHLAQQRAFDAAVVDGKPLEEIDFSTRDSIAERFAHIRRAMSVRMQNRTAQAALVAATVRHDACAAIIEIASGLEENERAIAESHFIDFVPSEFLRVCWAILIRSRGPIVRPGEVKSIASMLAGFVSFE